MSDTDTSVPLPKGFDSLSVTLKDFTAVVTFKGKMVDNLTNAETAVEFTRSYNCADGWTETGNV